MLLRGRKQESKATLKAQISQCVPSWGATGAAGVAPQRKTSPMNRRLLPASGKLKANTDPNTEEKQERRKKHKTGSI